MQKTSSETLKELQNTVRTPEQRAKLLISANILNENGHYHPDFFSDDTVAKSKLKNCQQEDLKDIELANMAKARLLTGESKRLSKDDAMNLLNELVK